MKNFSLLFVLLLSFVFSFLTPVYASAPDYSQSPPCNTPRSTQTFKYHYTYSNTVLYGIAKVSVCINEHKSKNGDWVIETNTFITESPDPTAGPFGYAACRGKLWINKVGSLIGSMDYAQLDCPPLTSKTQNGFTYYNQGRSVVRIPSNVNGGKTVGSRFFGNIYLRFYGTNFQIAYSQFAGDSLTMK